jgi:hypothetical protein
LNDKLHPTDKPIADARVADALLSENSIANFEADLEVLHSRRINALGVGFGGPLPNVLELEDLDWNFPFNYAIVDTSSSETIRNAELE